VAFNAGMSGFNYGTAGQVLTSCGPTAPPVWASGGGPADFSAVPEDILPLYDSVFDLGSTTKRWYDIYAGNKVDIGGASILGSNTGFVITKPMLIDQLLISDNLITPDSSTSRQYSGDKGWVVINGNLQVAGDELDIPVVQSENSNIPTFADNNIDLGATYPYTNTFNASTVLQLEDYTNQNFNGVYDNLVAGDYIQLVYTSDGTTQVIRLTGINFFNPGVSRVVFDFDPVTYTGNIVAPGLAKVKAQDGFVQVPPPIGGTDGAIRYNKDLQEYQGYSNSQWTALSAAEFALSGACGTIYSSEAGNGGTGKYNFFAGVNAGLCNTTGQSNNFFGIQAGRSNTGGSFNNFIGFRAGCSNTFGSCNNFIGPSAGKCNTSGTANNFFGEYAGGDNTSGTSNNFIGVQAGRRNTAGFSNAFIGAFAGLLNTTGGYNIMIGHFAGFCNTTGNNNIIFGCCAGLSITTQSNRIVMGNSAHTCAEIQIGWTTVSDVRDKCIFGAVPHGRGFLQNLETVEYAFKDRTTGCITDIEGKRRYGFSAQNVLAAEGEHPVIVSTENPDKLQLTSDYIIPVLVNAINELSREVDKLAAKIQALESK
jgi:hypothetical protein